LHRHFNGSDFSCDQQWFCLTGHATMHAHAYKRPQSFETVGLTNLPSRSESIWREINSVASKFNRRRDGLADVDISSSHAHPKLTSRTHVISPHTHNSIQQAVSQPQFSRTFSAPIGTSLTPLFLVQTPPKDPKSPSSVKHAATDSNLEHHRGS
jgi:hypothetical protein